MTDPDRYSSSPEKSLHPVVIHFLHMPEAAAGKVVLQTFQEPDLLREERVLVLPGLAGEGEALVIRDTRAVLPVLVKPGELPPVNDPALVGFTVEHRGVDAADGRPAVVDTAPPVFQKPAGSSSIIPCTQCVSRDVEHTGLVAELRGRRRFKGRRIDGSYYGDIPFEQEYMPVECPRAALRARCTAEPYLPDDTGETFGRVPAQTVPLLCQGSDAAGNRCQGNEGSPHRTGKKLWWHTLLLLRRFPVIRPGHPFFRTRDSRCITTRPWQMFREKGGGRSPRGGDCGVRNGQEGMICRGA